MIFFVGRGFINFLIKNHFLIFGKSHTFVREMELSCLNHYYHLPNVVIEINEKMFVVVSAFGGGVSCYRFGVRGSEKVSNKQNDK